MVPGFFVPQKRCQTFQRYKTKDICEVILKANVIMRSRVRERRTHGSVRGLRREPLVYSTVDIVEVLR